MKVSPVMIQRLLRFARRENGAALAELAILVPFLVIMLAAVAEVGRFFQTYTALAKSTRASARYLSNHTFDIDEQNRAKALVVCGKLACTPGEELVDGIDETNVCIEYQFPAGSPKPETVKVSIPRTAGCATPYNFTPIFDIGALLNSSFSLDVPGMISPSTTMYYMVE
ncbi:MAG: TadE/TadG family type IV pilus assembly protein [Pyrinomonadaceae bacterium]